MEINKKEWRNTWNSSGQLQGVNKRIKVKILLKIVNK